MVTQHACTWMGAILLLLLECPHGIGQQPAKPATQNPSPMVEHTRAHPRRAKVELPGRREKLKLGTLFLSEKLPAQGSVPLWIHFHGGTWLAEMASVENGPMAVVTAQLGSGSGVYGNAFREKETFAELVREAEQKSGRTFQPIGLSGWSAGYGAIRALLREPANYRRVDSVILLDGLHAGYVDGKPGPLESKLVVQDLDVFVQFARDAVDGKKQFLVTHSEIFPGTFASTTETSDYLLDQLGLKRRAVLQWGPVQTQQLSEVRQGRFEVLGFAGNSAPDHVDLLYALPEFLQRIRKP